MRVLELDLKMREMPDIGSLKHLGRIEEMFVRGSESEKKQIVLGLFRDRIHPTEISVTNGLVGFIFDLEVASNQAPLESEFKAMVSNYDFNENRSSNG